MQSTTILPLWPGIAPGSEGWDQVEGEADLANGLHVVRNVVRPSLTLFRPDQPNGTAVIVCPGGAWHFLAIEHEGVQVAEWLCQRGITAFVLKYRLIRTGENLDAEVAANMADRAKMTALRRAIEPMALADAQQAVRLVRRRASDWGLAPDRIGIMGFSAGGGVTTSVALDYTPDCRPDFAAPIYAAVFEDVLTPTDAPPLFLLCANDDKMATNASLLLYNAWNAAARPVEMHIYTGGGHGFGMKKLGLPSDTWIERFADWLQGLGLL